MQLGPNVKRLREVDSVRACVIAGPDDLMTWEMTACVDSGGVTLEVIGRGSDLEGAAAASAIAVLTDNGSTLGAPMDGGSISLEGARPSNAEQSEPAGCRRHPGWWLRHAW